MDLRVWVYGDAAVVRSRYEQEASIGDADRSGTSCSRTCGSGRKSGGGWSPDTPADHRARRWTLRRRGVGRNTTLGRDLGVPALARARHYGAERDQAEDERDRDDEPEQRGGRDEREHDAQHTGISRRTGAGGYRSVWMRPCSN